MNKKRYYKTLGTSLIYCPLPPSYLNKLNISRTKKTPLLISIVRGMTRYLIKISLQNKIHTIKIYFCKDYHDL